MKIERCTKPAFVVIGKEGSTLDGPGFIQKLWADANAHFSEVQPLAKRDEGGNLAGVECVDDAQAPAGWVKWTIPGYEYLCAEVEDENTFSQVLDYMRENHLPLVGAVHDFSSPVNGKDYMFFPIRIL